MAPLIRCGTFGGQPLYHLQAPAYIHDKPSERGYYVWNGARYEFLGTFTTDVQAKSVQRKVTFHIMFRNAQGTYA
jgi:hypothetical protein